MKIKFPKKGVITIDDLVYDHIYLVKDEVNDYGYLFYDAYSNHEYRIFKNEYIIVKRDSIIRMDIEGIIDCLTIIKDVTDTLEIKS